MAFYAELPVQHNKHPQQVDQFIVNAVQAIVQFRSRILCILSVQWISQPRVAAVGKQLDREQTQKGRQSRIM